MSWKFLNPETANPKVFGLAEVYALKFIRHTGGGDVRSVCLRGWETFADLLDRDPATGKRLERATWFIFAAKGRRCGHV